MITKSSIKRYSRQVIAFVERDLSLELRIKSNFILNLINPFFQLLTLIFIFGFLFRGGITVGYWNNNNFALFLLIAILLQFTLPISAKFLTMFITEKYWKTLSAIMIAPIHRFTLLGGVLISFIVIKSLPLIILFIIIYILYPISFLFIILFLIVYLLIYLTYASIGLFISVFAISNEKIVPYINFTLRFVSLFSCISYPLQIFPAEFQFFVLLNPFYYLFDLLRLTWYLGINYELSASNITYTHLILIILMPTISTIVALSFFERIFKKHGITGY